MFSSEWKANSASQSPACIIEYSIRHQPSSYHTAQLTSHSPARITQRNSHRIAQLTSQSAARATSPAHVTSPAREPQLKPQQLLDYPAVRRLISSRLHHQFRQHFGFGSNGGHVISFALDEAEDA